MAIAIAVTKVDTTQNALVVKGTLTLTGNYGIEGSHGDVVDFSTVPEILSNQPPEAPVIVAEAPAVGTVPTGYEFFLLPGATNKTGVLVIVDPASKTELTPASGYAAGLLGAALVFRATFPFGV